MAIIDADPVQDWTRAFDTWDRAQRRYDAAAAMGHKQLIAQLGVELEKARRDYNAALTALNA